MFRNRPKRGILLSWLMLAGGSCCFFYGAFDYLVARGGQERAAASWRVQSAREAPGSIPAGQAFARLSIPRLDALFYVIQGTDPADLRRGPGHLEGTALPGSMGNCVIAGHRDTHFRVLRNIHKGDTIEIETADGVFVYRVTGIALVSSGNTASLEPAEKPVLSLVTCYPFYYIGPAPERFVVRAEMVASRAPRRQAPPES